MRISYLDFLCCPICKGDLNVNSIEKENNGIIVAGILSCEACNRHYPIKNKIPRFVEHTYYADSFGEQWNVFADSQIDNERFKESEIRFNSEVGWTPEEISGKYVVEFGSGAGRFVDIVSKYSAKLAIGVDATDAVDASQRNLGDRKNVFFVQADFFNLPLKRGFFDFVYSIGVLHHTPEPENAFGVMTETAKVNGRLALSLYEISLYKRPNRNTLRVVTIELLWALNIWRCEFFRIFTTRIPSKVFLFYCKMWVPVLHIINKIPVVRYIRYFFPSTCYANLPVACSMVDTFDTYKTAIVHQYRGKDVFQWFLKQGLGEIILRNSRAGWVSVTGLKGAPEEQSKRRLVLKQPGDVGTID